MGDTEQPLDDRPSVPATQTEASFGLLDGNPELVAEYWVRKAEISASHGQYMKDHPELRAFLLDYLQLLMHQKPNDVFAFTNEYFRQ
eukprot:jgi/Hompol1/4501/HPOL_003670-RA